MQFNIKLPSGNKFALLYNKQQNNIQSKIELINKLIISHWEDYIYTRWFWKNKFDPFKLNHEDKVKMLLDRCGTFLLLGEFKNGMLVTPEKKKLQRKHEIPTSCTSTSVSNGVYSSNDNDDTYIPESKKSTSIMNNEKLINNHKLNINKLKHESIIKNYKSSQAYKLKKLYNSNIKPKAKLYKLSNRDAYEQMIKIKLSDSSNIEDTEEQLKHIFIQENVIGEVTDEEEWLSKNYDAYKKWCLKPFKNYYGENLYDYRLKHYKAYSRAIIDVLEPYIACWCYVDTDNVFEFENQKFMINTTVQQYQGECVCLNPKAKDKEREYDTYYAMDKILVFKQYDKLYFFDMNIDQIDNNFIKNI